MMRVLAIVVLAVTSASLTAAQETIRSFAGTSVGATYSYSVATNQTTKRITLSFGPADEPAFTVEYVYRFPGVVMRNRPVVIDQVVTRHMSAESTPRVNADVDGRVVRLSARLTGSDAVTTTLEYPEFMHLVDAAILREHVFEADLEVSAGQMALLRSLTAEMR